MGSAFESQPGLEGFPMKQPEPAHRSFRLTLGKGVTNIDGLSSTGEGEMAELASAINLDLDNDSNGRLRKGRVQRLAVTKPHSLKVHGGLAWLVSEGVLKALLSDYSTVDIATLSHNQRLSYQPINDELVVSNGLDIGWLEAGAFVPFAPTLDVFELPMPAGQYLAFYNGLLIVASGSTLYVSKPWNAEVRDSRVSEYPMNGYIRMLVAVENGLWVSTDKSLGFISGPSPEEWSYRERSDQVPPDGCFGSGTVRDGATITKIAFWAADGFYEGKAGGVLENLSQDRSRLPAGPSGLCMRREADGLVQYIAVIQSPEDGNISPDNDFDVHTISQ
jgi:hypothetical protein